MKISRVILTNIFRMIPISNSRCKHLDKYTQAHGRLSGSSSMDRTSSPRVARVQIPAINNLFVFNLIIVDWWSIYKYVQNVIDARTPVLLHWEDPREGRRCPRGQLGVATWADHYHHHHHHHHFHRLQQRQHHHHSNIQSVCIKTLPHESLKSAPDALICSSRGPALHLTISSTSSIHNNLSFKHSAFALHLTISSTSSILHPYCQD